MTLAAKQNTFEESCGNLIASMHVMFCTMHTMLRSKSTCKRSRRRTKQVALPRSLRTDSSVGDIDRQYRVSLQLIPGVLGRWLLAS